MILGRPKPSRVTWKLPPIDIELTPKAVYGFFQNIKSTDCVTDNDVKTNSFQRFLNEAQPIITDQSSAKEILEILIGIINNTSLRGHCINDCVENALKLKISYISFRELAFLDYLIHRLGLNDFYKELRLEIQMDFLSRIDELFNNCKNFDEIKLVVEYMRLNVDIISLEVLDKLAKCLMKINHTEYNIVDIMHVIVLFSNFDHLNEQSRETLNKMIKLWRERYPKFRDVELLLSLLVLLKNKSKRALEDTGLIQFVFEFLKKKCAYETLGCFQNLIEMVRIFTNKAVNQN